MFFFKCLSVWPGLNLKNLLFTKIHFLSPECSGVGGQGQRIRTLSLKKKVLFGGFPHMVGRVIWYERQKIQNLKIQIATDWKLCPIRVGYMVGRIFWSSSQSPCGEKNAEIIIWNHWWKNIYLLCQHCAIQNSFRSVWISFLGLCVSMSMIGDINGTEGIAAGAY